MLHNLKQVLLWCVGIRWVHEAFMVMPIRVEGLLSWKP